MGSFVASNLCNVLEDEEMLDSINKQDSKYFLHIGDDIYYYKSIVQDVFCSSKFDEIIGCYYDEFYLKKVDNTFVASVYVLTDDLKIYTNPKYRRRGIQKEMLSFLSKNDPLLPKHISCKSKESFQLFSGIPYFIPHIFDEKTDTIREIDLVVKLFAQKYKNLFNKQQCIQMGYIMKMRFLGNPVSKHDIEKVQKMYSRAEEYEIGDKEFQKEKSDVINYINTLSEQDREKFFEALREEKI